MRVLFLLLLLGNLLFLAWTRWVVPPAPAVIEEPVSSSRLHPIRLQHEAPVVTAVDSPPSLLAAACVSVGPFVDPAHADSAAAQLEHLGFTSRRRAAQDEVRVGSWVRVPNLATPADAANALATLQAAGAGDAAIVADGAPGNTVSIGVYADPAKAAEVAALVEQAGFVPETSDRLRTLEVIWLDIDRLSNGSLPGLEALGAPPEGGLPYDMRACPAATIDPGVTLPANLATPPAGAGTTG